MKTFLASVLFCLLCFATAPGAEPRNPGDELAAIDSQLKTLLAARMNSPAAREAMERLREIERTRDSLIAAIPGVRELDSEMRQLTSKLHELQRARAALIQKAKGTELAVLEQQATEARARVSGMDDPTIRALVQRRLRLLYGSQPGTNSTSSVSAATKTSQPTK